MNNAPTLTSQQTRSRELLSPFSSSGNDNIQHLPTLEGLSINLTCRGPSQRIEDLIGREYASIQSNVDGRQKVCTSQESRETFRWTAMLHRSFPQSTWKEAEAPERACDPPKITSRQPRKFASVQGEYLGGGSKDTHNCAGMSKLQYTIWSMLMQLQASMHMKSTEVDQLLGKASKATFFRHSRCSQVRLLHNSCTECHCQANRFRVQQ